jgi:RNA polymerase sigma-70 factor (ECF subfamily)
MQSRSLSNHLRQEPVESLSDSQLVEAMQDGNERAFHLLINRWNESIFNFCLRLTGDADDAADCTQKTFIKVYQRIGGLKSAGALKSWIYQIALNQCRDEIKRRDRFRFLRFGSASESDFDSEISISEPMSTDERSNPEISLQRSQLRVMIESALNKIPPEQREVVVMKELQQLTFPEIAVILGVSENTIKSRLYYGLKAMQKFLKPSSFYPL